MGYIFDIILLGVLISSVILCFKKGFLLTLKPFRKIAALVLAWTFKDAAFINDAVGRFIKTDSFKAKLNDRISSMWGDEIRAATEAEGVSIAERFDNVFGIIGKIFNNIKNFCISLYDKEFVAENAGNTVPPSEKVEEFTENVVNYIADSTASFFTTVISFILLFIIFSLIFWIAAKVLTRIFDKGIFGALNSCLGGVVGLFYGFLSAWILSIVFVLAVPLITPIELQTVTGGFGVVEWFYTKFFLSQLFGLTL